MYLFDTAALIGLTERGNDRSEAVIEADDELPYCHVVTLGELATGVRRAERGGPEHLALRRTTLTYARRLPRIDTINDRDVDAFAVISDIASRSLSHNDRWILAAALIRSAVLVTEDVLLFQVASDSGLAQAVGVHLGLTPMSPILV